MFYSVDRFEGEIAVLISALQEQLEVSKTVLPSHVREGDVLRCEEGIWHIEANETIARRKTAEHLLGRLQRRRDE